MKKQYWILGAGALLMVALLANRGDREAQTAAENIPEFTIMLKDHKFVPDKIYAKEGQKIRLIVNNMDNEMEEFEIEDLKVEKLVFLGQPISVVVGPLYKGNYEYEGEHHSASADGDIIVE